MNDFDNIHLKDTSTIQRAKASPKVFIVLVNWNGWHHTRNCLRSLKNLDYPDYRIIVVDNGSTDDSVQSLSRLKCDFTLLTTKKNLGFAGGSNVGIRHAQSCGSEYVWLLNNDTEVYTNALSAMVTLAESDPTIGAVGSILLEHTCENKVQVWGGGRVNLWSGLARQHSGRVAADEVHYLVGASLLVKCAALENTGLLDEDFFLYWEDADFCFRLRAYGWKLAVAEDSLVRHRGNASLESGNPLWDLFFTMSSKRFFRRHARVPVIPILLGAAARSIRRALRGEGKNICALWKGVCVNKTSLLESSRKESMQ